MTEFVDTEGAPPRLPSMLDALIPVVCLIVLLGLAVYLYGGDAIGGPVQVAMFLAAIIAGLVGYKNGYSVATLSKAAVDSVATAMGAIFILFAVGALIGTWNMSGTIATMTQWGIQILNPNWFYVTCVVICAAIALGIGSSWTVMGTIGVALIAIAEALGISTAMTAGAVISGAYFGDKMSPLSETTNLAPAVAGTDLYKHIRSMMITTVPSILIALGLYAFFGLRIQTEDGINVATGLEALQDTFFLGVIPMIPLIIVVVLAVMKWPPTIAIIAGALAGGLVAVFFQPDIVRAFVAEPDLNTPLTMIKGVWNAMATGFEPDTGYEQLDELLAGGGMESMLNTIWLIVVALGFGGIMNETGFLAKLIEPLRNRAKTPRGTLVATGTTAIGINALAADQYLAIVLTGNVFKQQYAHEGIAPQTLSRQIEDTATVTSPLIPWNSCGAYAAGVLRVETVAYFPFAFFNLINPILSFVFAILGIGIQKVEPDSQFPPAPHDANFYGVAGRHADEIPARLPDPGDPVI